jgi:ubiquinone/menaquinone biosynthesis C-methylase UbiE
VGNGDFSLVAAQEVAPAGRVFAVDIQKDLLDKLAGEARTKHLHEIIETVWGDIERRGGVKLADDVVDAVIATNVFFQVDSPYGLALEAKRILKKGGQVLVVDWADSFGGLGPPADQIFGPEKAEEVMKEAGFEKVNVFEAGDHHYGQVYSLNTK